MNTEELPKSKVLINDKNMSYVDIGSGETMLFLHGNPTSSYYGEILYHISQILIGVLRQT